jgi:amino acid adenylation domain-containing protein/non-ribosomal peptide synthase protein (TIGR01720 family)
MSGIPEFLKFLNKLNFTLELKDGKLTLQAFKNRVTREEISAIKQNQEVVGYINENKQALIEYLSGKAQVELVHISNPDTIPLTFAQEGLWFIDRLQGSQQYHIPTILELKGNVNAEALEYAFKNCVKRHQVLRTVIENFDGIPSQKVLSAEAWRLQVLDALDMQSNTENLINQPFDLSKDFMLRAHLIRLSENAHELLITLHHIAADGWSLNILIKEVQELYRRYIQGDKTPLADLPIQFADFAIWQRSNLVNEPLNNLKSYWKEALSNTEPIEVPLDFPRPKIQSTRGAISYFKIDKTLADRIDELSRKYEVTRFVAFLSAYQILLNIYSGQRNFCIGTPTAGRFEKATEPLIGFFINTLALPCELDIEKSYVELLKRNKFTVLDAFEHQQIPFEKVVETVVGQRNLERSPIFQVMFSFQNVSETSNSEIGDLSLARKIPKHTTARYELTLNISESNKGFNASFEYCTELFVESSIVRMQTHFHHLLHQIVTNPDKQLSQYELLSVDEQQALLKSFGSVKQSYDQSQTLISLFEQQVTRSPKSIALVFNDREITYEALEAQGNQLAWYLLENQIKPGELIAVSMERSAEMIVALMGILKAGAAYVPIDPNYPATRKAYMLKDTSVRFVITETSLEAENCITIKPISQWETINGYPKTKPKVKPKPEDLAYVIYTSGSTGNPKGVMVEHQSVVNLILTQRAYFGIDETERILQFSNLSFDASVEQIFLALTSGARLVLFEEGLQLNPTVFELFVTEKGITHLHATPGFIETLNLKQPNSLRRIIAGGDWCKAELANKYKEGLDFYNEYGPTETTVTAIEYKAESQNQSLPIGKGLANTEVYVLSESQKLQPVGVPGEIYLSGVQVARGYLNNEAQTKERFLMDPFNQGQRMYRTGDIGRWLADGNLEYLGRKDQQVKIRGYRIELGEIEAAIESISTIKQSAVLAKTDALGNKRLVAYVVKDQGYAKEQSIVELKQRLPEYMVPQIWVELETIPLTTNGKVDHKALPDPDMEGQKQAQYAAPRTQIEHDLVEIWQDLLGIKQIGIYDNFFELGGHSLLVMRIIASVRQKMGVELTVVGVFENPKICELAIYIESVERVNVLPPILTKVRPKFIPLSFAQERLWFIDQLEGSRHFHIPIVLRFNGNINENALAASFHYLINRHEILRTTIYQVDGVAFQKVNETGAWSLLQINAQDNSEHELQIKLREMAYRPFNLETDFMIRVALFHLKNQESLLALTMHHIVSDGWSTSILVDELKYLYETFSENRLPELQPLPVQYADFAIWQRTYLQEEVLQRRVTFWKNTLADVSPLQLPTDFPRPAIQTFNGAVVGHKISKHLLQDLKGIGTQVESTLFMTLLSAFNILIYRYTNQKTICIGTPVAGRQQKELEPLIGFFINTLALKNVLDCNQTFLDFLQRVKANTLLALEHQDLPFEKVVEALELPRDLSRSPLFQVFFVLQNTPDVSALSLKDVTAKREAFERQTAQYELTLNLSETMDGLHVSAEYNTDLFLKSSIERLLKQFDTLLSAIVKNPNDALDAFEIVEPFELNQLISEFNNTQSVYPERATLVSLFESQVNKTPDHTALSMGDSSLSYCELNVRSNRVAHYLLSLGVGKGSQVPVCLPRGLDLWIAFLGILKAGGSYVPIDPEYPEQRMAYMLEDCGATFWLGDDNLPALKNGINLFKEASHIESFSESNPLQTLLPSDLAYCVYTSGSTGKPKGVMVKHEALVNLVNWHNKRYEVSAQSKSTSMAGVGFDALGWEVWPYLMAGACVEILTNQQRLSPKTIVELIENKGITHSYISTALVGEMAERMRHKPTNLQYMTTAGDQLLSMDIEGLDYKLVNNYGPTEFTICASSYQLTERDKTALPLIGKPIDNTQIYLLSEGGKLCPIGVPGELYLGGMGLAKGYINNPGLTEEKFVRNPFDSQSYVYRTGDLGRWLPDGNLEFLGRIDDQVKIRGYRIELGEIENVLQGMEGISQAVVMARTDKAGTKRLVAYLVTNEGFDKEKAMEGLKAQLPEYMLPQFWVELQELPLTPNGKIDKKALPEPDVIESLQTIYEAPRNATEKVLVEIWEEVLGVSPIGIHDNFFELGGHSILIMRIISLVRIRLDIELSVMLVFKNPSIAQCSEIVRSQINELRLPSIFKADRESRIPLSFAQERLWFIHKLEGSTQYHIPAVLKLVGDLNFQALEESLKQVINRHEILRTTIHEEDGQGYQRINAPDKWRMDWIDAKNETDSELNQRIDDLVNRPFKFEADPMLRAAIIEKGKHEFLLVVTLHHIAADGWSISIVVNEMVSLYKAFITKQSSNLQELHIQYADYAIWQKSYLKGDLLSEKLKYWTQKLSNPEPLNLLTDFPRKLRQINQGATTSLKADNSLLISLKALSQTRGMTLFMTLLAGFKALLYRYTNQGDITIGTTVAGRQQRELEPLIGFFINTLALRDNIEADDNFESLLEKVKTTVLDALEHQDLPFEKVVDAVVKEREVGRSPLFQVLFSFHNIPEIPPLELPGITISNERSRNTTSQFDIICNVTELSDGIQFSMQYNTGLYRQATIHCLLTHYVSLLSEVAERPSQKITAVTYVSQGEITELTSKFNPEKPLSIPYDTIITSIQEVVVKHSKELAFIHGNESIRFEDLNKRSNQLANWLIEKGLSNETPVAVCLDRSIDMMIAILGVLKAGATYVPVDSNSPSERLKYIVEDSGVRIIITKGELPGLTSINRVEVFDFEKESKTLDKFGEANPDLEILPNHCAYIIYTSGSTGKPKGVIVEHGSLMAYLYNGKTNYMQKAGKQTGSFIHLANTFDASLTALFLPLLNGKTAILGSGDAIEVFNDPNFLKYAPYDFLKITPAHLELLRTIFENSPKALTSKLVIGGEALKLSQWAYLKNLEYAIDIINEYGPTEATVGCISHSINTHTFQEAEGELPIGKPFDGVKIFILDISKQWVPIGVAGELYISGRQVARGYLNNLELTKERFLDTGIFEGSAYKLYKTGDLARWLPDGNIEFFGRTDEQIKIRGHRIEPGEIESAVKSLENITDCLVIAKPDQNGTNNLVAYIVSKTGFNKTEAIESLRKILPEYMFPLYWVELEQLPLNSSGKVDKKQLPEPNSQATLQEGYVLPQTQTQKALATIWCDLLEIDEIGIYDNFFDIGGHSLLAIRLIASLRKEFDVEMPILMVFDHPTIFSQESVLNELKKGDVLPQIKAMPWPERIPLSFSQERLWFIDKLEGTRAYHLPSVLKLKGNLDTNILEKSIQAIVDRHSVLRTVYLQENGVAYQSVNPKDLWQLQTMNGTSVSPDKLNETIREFVDQPFDLAKDPMVRALLVKTGKDEYVLAVTLHHIASDGWSTSILVKELVANYQAFSQGKEPEHAPLAVQYADYAIWQRTYLQGDLLAKKLEYWKTKLASPQALELQTDYPRAAMQSNKGAVVSVKTDKQLSQAIEEMSHANGSTVFMSLLAAFKVLLYRYTGQTDIVVGTPMAGRQQQELEPLIGFFINTLALRDELNLEQTFNEVLQQVKQTTLEAYQHQDVPFEKIVDAVVKERDLSRSPLFQVMFVFQNTPEVPKLQLGDIELSRESSEHITAQFELTLSVSESKSGLNLSLSYRTDLFSEQTVKQILIHFHSILHQIVSNPEKPVGEYRLLGEKQEQELLRSNASIERSYDNKQTLVSLFSQRVLQSPKAIALEFKDRQITYEALEAQSNQLAWYLLDQKVKPRELIAISMERSPEMIVGLMGILKAGAAYVPIDPNYPALRKAYMLKDSKARFVITETPVETENCKAIKPISGREELKHYPTTNPAIEIKPEDLAYVIYTSGSTGTPKGVMVEHQSVVNLICAQSEYFKIDETERILQFSNLSFDASVEQIFLALSAGGTLVLFEEGLQLKSGVFEQFITEKGITHFHATPGFIETLNITQPNSLRRIIAGGDWCKAELANKYQGKYDFYNEYGPTETTVTALIYKAENQIRSLPIGKGLANTNVYVLSETQNLQPLGVPGEIYISGIQVARGYLNRKEQSEAVFLNDPFKQGQRMYRTGDMGRWLADGNLEYLGRKDEQVKIRGYRIELGEIETAIERLPTVKQSAVLAKADAQGHKRLVAYVVKQEGYSKEQSVASLKQSLPEYMVPQIWVEVEQIALTANGKVDRKTLPEPDMEGQIQSQYAPAGTQTEQDLVGIWQELLGIKRIGIYDNFFELGGDSILTIQLVSRASKKGYQLQPKDIFIHQKIASLAEWLEIGRNQISMAEQGLLEGVFNLLPIQYDFFNRGIKQASHYNQSLLLAIDKRVSSDKIGASLKSLVNQHDALRLKFINQEGQWMQTYTLAEPELLIEDLSTISEANLSKKVTERAAYYQKTLAIEKGMVFQAVWMKMPDSESHNRLLLIAHHLVVDGVSWRIILEDLETLISAHNSNQVSELGPKTTSYRQWAEALVKYGQTPEIKAQKTYWDNACSLHTALPTDFETQEALLLEHLSNHAVNLNASLTEQLLQQVPKAYQTEINDILLASLVLTITNWTKASALRIGLEGHGRESFDDEINTSRTVGWFTTLYPVLLECDSKNPGNLIKSVKEQLRQIPNKGLGYGILKYLQKESVLQSDNPWDLVFNYFGQLDGVAKKGNWLTGAKESTGLNSDSENEIQDKLTINSRVQNGKLSLSWTFSRLHFKKETIEQLASKYIENLEALIQHCVNIQEIQKTPSDYGLQAFVNYREFDAFLQQQWGDDSLYIQIESVYPLSALQQGMLFHSLYDENGHAYMERFSWELQNINQAYFEQSWELVLQNHSILRSAFFQGVFKIPVQAVFKKVPLPIQWLDYRHLNEKDQTKAIKTFETNDSALPFDFESAPLMRIAVIRISDQRYKMIWTSHHILFDGWSIPVLNDEFLSIYQSLQNQIPLGESKVDYYEDYIRYIAQKNKWKEQDFWQTFLSDLEEPTLLPWIHNSSKRNKGEGRYESKSIKINSSLTQQAQLFAQGKRITMNTLIQGVWSKLLHHFTGNNTVVYGVVVSGRPDDLINVEKKVGLFINTLPHRTNFSAEISIQDYLQTIQDEQLKAREYQYSSLSEIQAFTSVSGDLFDTLVVFENYPVSKVIASDKEGLSVDKVKVEEHTNYPLTLLVGVADEIHVSFSYNTALLEEETVAQISTRFSEVLGQMIGDELQLVSQISLITEDEQNQLLSSTQEVRKVDYPKEQTLVSLFEEQVVRTPLKIALVFEEHSMTYQELNQKANQLANLLRSKGVKPDSLVPICLERSLEMIVGILGILKAGGAYVPIDPLYPEDRIRFMIQDCNAGLVVTAQEGIVSLENEFEFINLSKDFESLEAFDTADLKPLAGPENLAYIIYTSGSTGKPKGVMIEHKNLVRLFKTDKPLFDFNDRDVWTMFHSFCFDFSVWEMYGALLYGGKLVIVPESCTKDTKVFAELVHHEQVTVLNQTPSAFQVLQEYMTSEFEEIPIRYVIFGGEALQPASLKTWNSSYPKCQLINMYGITETTVHVTYLALNTQHFQSNISSIGKPIPTLSVYVLDAYGNLQLPGIEGEMYVGGEGLARGYLNNPLLTEDRFITNPFNADERLYKTGDLAKWALDGSLEYLGRIDEQVKIRGFRIELGEIENTLLQFEEVSQAVVLAKADAFDVKRLVAYLVAKEEFEKDRAIEHLKQTLPDYMIPSFWVVLPEMPLTRNGKIDKKALPEVELAIQDGNESEEYLSETEHRLLKIWQELLGHKAIRTGSNFFEIGGHSLLAMRLMTALRREFDVEIRIKDIFSNPTLSELAKHIQAQNETLEVPLMLPVSDSETHIPLSFAQERLWFIDKLEGSRQFNLPIVLNLKGHIDANFLERCLNEIVNRHKVLRTVFVERNGEVVSELKPKNEWKLQRLSHADVSSQAIDSLILHPFDLSRDYMVRSNLLELSAEESVLVTVLHHIATDAWSNGVLVKEVMELYSAFTQGRTPDLKPLLLQYSDYAIWQRRYLQGDVLERKIAYWKQKLSETAFLDLPTDYVRPAQRGIAGAIEGFSIPIELSQSVNTLSKSIGTTLFMTLLSVYKVLLSKYSRQQDICVGTSIANRPQQELEELIGFFVNTLALRTELLEQDTFSGLLEKVKETTLEAYANQEVPFEKVVETGCKAARPKPKPAVSGHAGTGQYAGSFSPEAGRTRTLSPGPQIQNFQIRPYVSL